ncbi:MAG: anhydro-N-acetylmuramic acid kinase [Elusimicrobiales bacterium]
MKNKPIRVIGLMSGTSADGLTAAYCLIDFDKRKIDVKAFKNYEYDLKLQKRIIEARSLSLKEIVNLHYDLGKIWSDMIIKFLKEFNIRKSQIDLISSHGQTVYHSSPDKITLQIGEPEFISRNLDIPVAYDFRVGDIIFGGEGAPLIPFMDEFLFGEEKKPVCLLNIGGISNISVVGRGVETYGFDVGPGNTLMDWAIGLYTGGKKTYDKDGQIASKGKINFKKIDYFIKNKFFYQKPPKSLDREEFGKEFVLKNFDFKKEKIEDVMATLNFFTAKSVEISLKKFVKEKISKLIISGGGVFNKTLFSNISSLLNDISVESIEKYGIHPLSKEAAGFALIGAARVLGIKSNIISVTGAKKSAVLGKISPSDNFRYSNR